MKNKIIVGASILLAVFIIFLLILCGGTGSDKIVTKEELETNLSSITCEVKNSDDVNYDISLVTNDIQFDSNIKTKNYTKITINKTKEINFLGLAFMVKSYENTTFNFTLTKNGTELKTTSVSVQSEAIGNVDLLLDEAVNFSSTDELAITISQSGNSGFIFDTMIFFFDEV